MKRHGRPEVIVTDRLRSYGAALKDLGRGDDREMDRWLNNRAENSHLPFRRRERAMSQFRRMRTLLKFASTHASVHNHFPTEHHIQRRKTYKLTRAAGLSIHTQHRVRQNTATRILADFAQTATAPPGDRKIDFAGVLDRQKMPTRAALRRLRAPAIEQRLNRHARIGPKARKSDNPTASATRRPPQANARARHHSREQQTPFFARFSSPISPSTQPSEVITSRPPIKERQPNHATLNTSSAPGKPNLTLRASLSAKAGVIRGPGWRAARTAGRDCRAGRGRARSARCHLVPQWPQDCRIFFDR